MGRQDGAAVTLIEEGQAPLLARPYYAEGDPGPIVAALAQVPEMLVVALPFLGTVLGPSALPARTKELVILRTSARAACRYCVETHTVVARDAGLSTAEVRALRGEADHCNLACRYCLTESAPNSARRILPAERMVRAAHQAAEIGFTDLGVSGGEPFLRPDMPETLACLAETSSRSSC